MYCKKHELRLSSATGKFVMHRSWCSAGEEYFPRDGKKNHAYEGRLTMDDISDPSDPNTDSSRSSVLPLRLVVNHLKLVINLAYYSAGPPFIFD